MPSRSELALSKSETPSEDSRKSLGVVCASLGTGVLYNACEGRRQ